MQHNEEKIKELAEHFAILWVNKDLENNKEDRFENIKSFIKEIYTQAIEDCIKCVPTKVVNGKLREEKWKHGFGQPEINAYNLHRKQTITNLEALKNK